MRCLAVILAACGAAWAADAYAPALDQIRAGRTVEAERALLAIARERPADGAAPFYLGTIRATRQDWRGAVEYYTRAAALDPRNGKYHRALGYAHKDAGNFPAALAALRTSLDLQPDAAAWFTLGAILRRQEQDESAKEALRAGLAIEPGNAAARLMLADALLTTSDPSGARSEYGAVAKADPANTHAQLGIAQVAMLDPSRAAEAEPALLSVIRREPRNFSARYQLAQLYERTGRDREAAAEVKTALEIDPRSAPAILLASRISTRLGEAEAGRELRERFEKQRRAAVLARSAKDLAQSSRLDEAAAALEEALALDPGSAAAHVQYAKILISRNSPAAAKDHLEAARQLDHAMGEAHYLLAVVLRLEHRPADALAAASRAAALSPRVPDVHNLLGVICAESGRHGEAAVHFERAVELDPADAVARLNLAASRGAIP